LPETSAQLVATTQPRRDLHARLFEVQTRRGLTLLWHLKLQLEPVLLDEEAARGRPLIEKFETLWPVAFVVVLLTGDDVGGLAPEPRKLRLRARQNVIFELGYSIAKLTRERVCALYEEGVELPSDFRASNISRSMPPEHGKLSSPGSSTRPDCASIR